MQFQKFLLCEAVVRSVFQGDEAGVGKIQALSETAVN